MTDATKKDTCAYCPFPGPRCEYHHCRKPATCHVWQPRWRSQDRPPVAKGQIKFMCDECYQIYCEAMTKPMKGIDRPPHADEDWKPSILEHIRHAQIAIAFEERKHREQVAKLTNGPRDPRWTAIVNRMIERRK